MAQASQLKCFTMPYLVSADGCLLGVRERFVWPKGETKWKTSQFTAPQQRNANAVWAMVVALARIAIRYKEQQ